MTKKEIGTRRRRLGAGLKCIEEEYRPEATKFKDGLVTFANGKLGRPTKEEGWVEVFSDGLCYPYINEQGKKVG